MQPFIVCDCTSDFMSVYLINVYFLRIVVQICNRFNIVIVAIKRPLVRACTSPVLLTVGVDITHTHTHIWLCTSDIKTMLSSLIIVHRLTMCINTCMYVRCCCWRNRKRVFKSHPPSASSIYNSVYDSYIPFLVTPPPCWRTLLKRELVDRDARETRAWEEEKDTQGEAGSMDNLQWAISSCQVRLSYVRMHSLKVEVAAKRLHSLTTCAAFFLLTFLFLFVYFLYDSIINNNNIA